MSNADVAKGLRELADYAEKSELEILPTTVNVPTWTKNEFQEKVKKLGSFKKCDSDGFLSAVKEFSGGVKIDVYCSKSMTCKRVVKEYKTVPAAPAIVIDAVPEHQEPVYGWECPKSFLESEIEEPVPAA